MHALNVFSREFTCFHKAIRITANIRCFSLLITDLPISASSLPVQHRPQTKRRHPCLCCALVSSRFPIFLCPSFVLCVLRSSSLAISVWLPVERLLWYIYIYIYIYIMFNDIDCRNCTVKNTATVSLNTVICIWFSYCSRWRSWTNWWCFAYIYVFC